LVVQEKRGGVLPDPIGIAGGGTAPPQKGWKKNPGKKNQQKKPERHKLNAEDRTSILPKLKDGKNSAPIQETGYNKREIRE